MIFRRNRLSLLVMTLCSAVGIAHATVRSPWDGHSVKLTDIPRSCPTLRDLPADLVTDGFYRLDDPTHSIVDPERMKAYNESSGPVKDAAKAIVEAGDAFRTTGSRDAARCTLRLLAQMAHNNTMGGRMSSAQAYYVQGWLAGAMAVAYLKVRESGFDTPAQAASIGTWLARLGTATRTWYDEAARKHPEGNNHLYWAGAEMAAIAAVANRQDLLDWAMAAYKNGVDQIQPDGTLPLEMARGQRALHYHLYALTPLVFLAEFGEANGTDLYALDNRALARLVALCVHGVTDPSLFAQRTGTKQEVTEKPSGDDAYWTKPYARRFPSAGISAMSASAKTLSSFYLGGLPPD
jgi:poly(beta-D-mannuronate) lyase